MLSKQLLKLVLDKSDLVEAVTFDNPSGDEACGLCKDVYRKGCDDHSERRGYGTKVD